MTGAQGAESSIFARGPIHYAVVVFDCFLYDFAATSSFCVFPERFRTHRSLLLTVSGTNSY